ncbi:hypothetical protein IW261DRAFT_1351155, partial [Armillaria novae-zelandiae]
MGVDDQSQGIRAYWPNSHTITVERNIYYNKSELSAQDLEGEDLDIQVETPANSTHPDDSIPAVPTTPISTLQQTPATTSQSSLPSGPVSREQRARQPSQRIRDIIEGHGVTSSRPSDPHFTIGTQLPPENVAESQADWMMGIDDTEEYALAAAVSEMEGMDPHDLAEARGRSDWPKWETRIAEELASLKSAGTWELVDLP